MSSLLTSQQKEILENLRLIYSCIGEVDHQQSIDSNAAKFDNLLEQIEAELIEEFVEIST